MNFKKWFHRLRFQNFPYKVPEERQSGRTTRLVDEYIQKLFNEGTILKPKDHEDNHQENERLMYRIRKRLENEHPHIIDLLKTNTKNCISFFHIDNRKL